MPEEAKLVETDAGLVPDGDGWFVVNVADAAAYAADGFGHGYLFEKPRTFPHFGINLRVLYPGDRASLYHAEGDQEAFLVVRGECLLVVEEQERTLREWDFFYAAPGTAHTFVGAGEGPCAIVMVGARNPGSDLVYPVSEVAQRHGVGVETEAYSGEKAYGQMGWERPRPARREWPPK